MFLQLWLTFAPVADKVAERLNVTLDQVNWLSVVYMVVAIPLSFITTWMLDTWGLRPTMILGSWLNMAGSVLRVVGVLSYLPVYTWFPIVMTGQVLCALAQPLVIFSPTKLAALWFPEHQRATANMIASMSTVGIQESVPPMPPSASADTSNSESFSKGIKSLLTNKAYMVLLVCFGSGIGIFTCFSTLLDQILCVKGYSNDFAGLCGALFILFGVFGAAFLGLFVDKTKLFTESIKISMCLTSLVCTAFAVVSQLGEQKVIIGAVCALFGLFGFAIYPIAMELSVECSYPVGEATSAGLVFISGQIQSIVYTTLLTTLTTKLTDSSQSVCAAGDDANLNWMATCFFVIFFHTPYRRLNMEAEAAENHSIQTETQGLLNNGTDT
ncbi:Major facilitator superfamily domain-containing protein 7 [Bagarius yarrelli]|uniref:Major facilitator superfamily domain-containing protein 7 n=1 Tax=Bagarius yarrelli TaxID=175774 RepID=A0A556TRJ4_BAGYA|nr:Major facilitator superfamily domain-containing protein 7 [Bagarius yarrelli]